MKEKISQIYRGFKILVVKENGSYSAFLSSEDKNIEQLYNFKIIGGAKNFAKAMKKTRELIDKAQWEKYIYNPFEIHIAEEFSGWAYKITRGEDIIKTRGNLENKIDAVQIAFIEADKEWRKLRKK